MIRSLFRRYIDFFKHLAENIIKIQEALGRIETRQLLSYSNSDINANEFRVFSQSGNDGIIQYLINKIPIQKKIFVEFGVEDFKESNTRFLLSNNYWSGLVIDGSKENIKKIKKDHQIYWAYNLKAHHSFITVDNINHILVSNGVEGNIGILSVDIDGNDYWIWEAINCVDPDIVICEYNAIFGKKLNVTIPYDENFSRLDAHYSNIYYGASIKALNELAKSKGYFLVGTDKSGNDVFFVKNKFKKYVNKVSLYDAFNNVQHRETKDITGQLTFETVNEARKRILDMNLYDLNDGKIKKLAELIDKI